VGHAAGLNRRIDDASVGFGSSARISAEGLLLRRAIDCVPDGVVITTQQSAGESPAVLYANAAFAALAGLAPGNPLQEQEEDKPPQSSAPPWSNDPLWKSLKQCHQGDGVYSAEIVHRSRDGSQVLLQLWSEPVRDESGQIAQRIAVFRDATVQTNLEAAVRQNERLACLGLLAAGIAHEINNPMGSALVAAETAQAIKDSPDAGEQLATCLQNIVTSMERCGRIVKTLLRYTRHEPTEKQACNLNDVAEQSIELVRPYGESRGAQLRLDLDPAAPLVSMNPLEIELALVNVLRNAIEAGSRSEVVTVRTLRIKDGVRVEVRDNGCGMNQQQIAHLFDPLYTTHRQTGGSGLGMGITLGTVQEHEGHMEVQSQPGQGTTVTIDLPIAATNRTDEENPDR